MTWQRIDENIYIDDTLVTCAEYQLFIDEMRKQGKYYQPDHWTSYRFPKGKATTPILGIRFYDAKMFCEWLNKREKGKNTYRLPMDQEVRQYTIEKYRYETLGCWAVGDDGALMFSWLGSIPSNPRKISVDKLPLTNKFGLDFSLNLDRCLMFDFDGNKGKKFQTILKRINPLVLDRNIRKHHHIDLVLEHVDKYVLHHWTRLALTRERNRPINRVRNLSYYLDVIRTRDPILTEIFKDDRDEVKAIFDLVQVLDLYVDIYTLRERIAGRSPAFEGIRLVRERIR